MRLSNLIGVALLGGFIYFTHAAFTAGAHMSAAVFAVAAAAVVVALRD